MIARISLAVGLLLLGCLNRAAFAHTSGIAGYSGEQGVICTACHAGGRVPTVAFDGPSTLDVGATGTYAFTVQSTDPLQTHAGLDIAANGGTLQVITGQLEQLCDQYPCNAEGQEITHTRPKLNSGGQATWKFKWIAPAIPGNYILWGAGNSVNFDMGTGGDNAAGTHMFVAVGGVNTVTPTFTSMPSPTRTLSPTPEAPSPSGTPILTSTPTDSPAATGTATDTVTPTASPSDTTTPTSAPPSSTVTGTSTPTASSTATDTPTPIPTPTPTPTATLLVSTPTATPSAVTAGDANCDQQISAADLSALLLQLTAGSPGVCGADANGDRTLDEADLETIIDLLFAPGTTVIAPWRHPP